MMRRRNRVGQSHNRGGWGTGRLLTFSSVSAKRIRVLLHFVGPWFVKWDFQTRRTGRDSTTADLLGNQKPRGPLPQKGATSCFFLPLSPNKCPKGTPANPGNPITNHPQPTPAAANECFPGTRRDGETWWDGEVSVLRAFPSLGVQRYWLALGSALILPPTACANGSLSTPSQASCVGCASRMAHLSNRFVCVSLFATRSGALVFTPGTRPDPVKQQPAGGSEGTVSR